MQKETQIDIEESHDDLPNTESKNQMSAQVSKSDNSSDDILKRFYEDQDCRMSKQENNIFIKVFLGRMFIEGYRVLKKYLDLDIVTLYKKEARKTIYLFALFATHKSIDHKVDLLQIPISSLEKLKQSQIQQFYVHLVFIDKTLSLKFDKVSFLEFVSQGKQSQGKLQLVTNLLESCPSIEPHMSSNVFPFCQTFIPRPNQEKESVELLIEFKKVFEDLGRLLAFYVDTFANQEKASFIYKETEKSLVSFSVPLLLNTFNYIVYEETKNQPYSSIESAYWTIYRVDERALENGKKIIMLSGSGQLCILQMLFESNLCKPKQKELREYKEILDDCLRFYTKAKIKRYQILRTLWDGSDQSEEKDNVIDLESQSVPQSQNNPSKDQNQITSHDAPQIMYNFDTIVLYDFNHSHRR